MAQLDIVAAEKVDLEQVKTLINDVFIQLEPMSASLVKTRIHTLKQFQDSLFPLCDEVVGNGFTVVAKDVDKV